MMACLEISSYGGHLLLQSLGCQLVGVGQFKIMFQFNNTFNHFGNGWFKHTSRWHLAIMSNQSISDMVT